MLHTSNLTSRFQATIPVAVRKALRLKVGDVVGFEIRGDEVKLTRAAPAELAFAQALAGTLDEWSGAQDDKAFKDL